MAVRVSLTERVSIEAGGVVVDEQRFPGRQGRLVFAYLLAAHGRPVPRQQLERRLPGVDRLLALFGAADVRGGTLLLDCRTLAEGEVDEVAAAVAAVRG